MRLRFFLCASAEPGVRRTKVSSSFCNSEYIFYSSKILKPHHAAIRLNSATASGSWLVVQLQCKLHQARISHFVGHTEARTVGRVAVHVVKMCVIRHIKDIPSELEMLAFADRDLLLHGYIRGVQTRTAADSPLRSAVTPEGRRIVAVENCVGGARGLGWIDGIIGEAVGIKHVMIRVFPRIKVV